MTWENSWEYRYELSDYDHIHERYKFGDIVKFKYPICGYSKGIITGIAEPEIGTGDICISRLYDVFCEKYAHLQTIRMVLIGDTCKARIGIGIISKHTGMEYTGTAVVCLFLMF